MKENIKTEREFRKKFPSEIYICSRCGNMTTNPHHCTKCGNQSNNIFYHNKTYRYVIEESGRTDEIFKPIEIGESASKDENDS